MTHIYGPDLKDKDEAASLLMVRELHFGSIAVAGSMERTQSSLSAPECAADAAGYANVAVEDLAETMEKSGQTRYQCYQWRVERETGKNVLGSYEDWRDAQRSFSPTRYAQLLYFAATQALEANSEVGSWEHIRKDALLRKIFDEFIWRCINGTCQILEETSTVLKGKEQLEQLKAKTKAKYRQLADKRREGARKFRDWKQGRGAAMNLGYNQEEEDW